ncbi:putative polyketide synthase [Aspergillus fischeri NRRL 181]|uniref:Polyketide synthase, putative n=1 Tax=Neosartorya fischeri (strain ATCC 1020 / DSM 3700 / CBS 544.65 / FGSC A1164 / JCM 1740 / NRRL 181 / WB 181) TaxID=331117 RepID=A1DNL6_NEOFI|nr:polyketide synthase, putative [Aspergillus fischeri NRRL 181]EAW16387.1 polyketide synthase, putative [Aspergillus fischeri NRRL 181]
MASIADSPLNFAVGPGQLDSLCTASSCSLTRKPKDKQTETDKDRAESDDSDIAPVPFPIAIVGMSMRLPGGVNCEKEFWDFLINKRDGLCRVPDNRYNIDAFYKESTSGAIRTQHGYFLQQDIAHFDASFFGMSKVEAARLDPQQRMLMEIVWECMENGGQTQWRGKNIGCYVGVFGEDWLDLLSKDTQANDRYRVIGAGDFALSNRISYEFDLRGPSMTIRTGCSSSLVGLHEACQALYAGECSSALVAGTNLIITPTMTTSMSDNMVISKSGICRTFDAAADGYGRGEAVNAIYIKPLDAALRDGDPVRAVIRSTAVNCDGKTPSITTPGSQAQERLIRRAYRRAQITDVFNTGFFECHGTGTVVGDTAETSVVAKVFGDHGIHIGAVKANVGHSEGASGITSIIKCVLSLEKKTILPNVFFNDPNPNIPFKQAKLQVPTKVMPWPIDRCQRVSVNSFGVGGTNAHLIMDSALTVRGEGLSDKVSDKCSSHLLLVSAKTPKSLDGNIEALKAYVDTSSVCPSDLAYTLALKREHMVHRAFAILDPNGHISSFERLKSGCPQVTFVFTGQGAQWPGMGRELLHKSERFRHDIKMLDRVLQTLENQPKWSIEGELLQCNDPDRLKEADVAQTLCAAVQIGVVNILREWGVTPSSVIGHSSGEIAAAYASGAIPAEVAIRIAYWRGQTIMSSRSNGAMAAVGLGREQIRPYLREGVVIACENSPRNITISGDQKAITEVVEEIQASDDIFCRSLAVNVAYHSPHMKDLGELFEKRLSSHMSYNKSMVPLISTVTGQVICEPDRLNARYWRQNLESPVLFRSAVQTLIDADKEERLFLEIGPHSALSSPLRQIFSAADNKRLYYVPTLVRRQDQWRCILATAGQLYIHGAAIELAGPLAGSGKTLTDLPPYSWEYNERFWSETRLARDWRLRQYSHHELLGSRALESTDIEPMWRNLLKLDNVLWLLDHRLSGEVVFPCAGYIAMVGEAIRQTSGSNGYSIRNMFIRTALVLSHEEHGEVEIITSLRPARIADNVDSVWYDFTITAHQDSVWTKHCLGQVCAGHDRQHAPIQLSPHSRHVSSDKWYEALEAKGLEYGPRFRGLDSITASPLSPHATAVLHPIEETCESHYTLHPILIDQCLQLLSVAATNGLARRMTRLCIPTAISSLHIADGQGEMSVGVSCDSNVGATMRGNALLVADNRTILSMEDGMFFSISDTALRDDAPPMASTLHWKPHIDFVTPDKLLPPFPNTPYDKEQVGIFVRLVIIETYHQTRSAAPAKEHLRRYHQWIGSQYKLIHDDVSNLLPEMRDKHAAKHATRWPQIQRILDAEQSPVVRSVYSLAQRILRHIHEILDGRCSPLELLMEGEGIQEMYKAIAAVTHWDAFLALLGHSNPRLRVLEIGGGTGGATRVALNALVSSGKGPLYTTYAFTDLSPGFVSQAKEKFAEFRGIEYTTLDISQDPELQGFTPGSYDLIIAANVLHATPRISDTLRNVRRLLAPTGRLLLQELCCENPLIGYIMGSLPSWWIAEDGRDVPYMSPEKWHDELVHAGFTGADVVRLDYDTPYQFNAHIVSRPYPRLPIKGEIGLVHQGKVPDWAQGLGRLLSSRGYVVKWTTLDESPTVADFIFLLDLEKPFFDNLSPSKFHQFQRLTSHITKGRSLWLMRSIQLVKADPDPARALTLGVMRTIRQELARGISTVEIEQLDDAAMHRVIEIFEKVKTYDETQDPDLDYEYVLKDNDVYVGRFQWSSLDRAMTSAPKTGSRVLDIGSHGMLDTLKWSLSGRGPCMADDDIEVDIRCVGLNFKDIMVSMGLMGDTSEMGLEGSGIVRRVGRSVTTLQAGDRVLFAGKGMMATRKVMPVGSCIKIPSDLSLEDAAAGPCVFTTVIYSLMHVGQLRKGQSVLIHSACGGVGLAAIQVCQMIGTEIFVTVGSSEKKKHLIDNLQIPEHHIFDSRSPSFLPDVMRITNNRGVDIVLNSLSGELLHASWKCVAPFGKMIELGKRDFLGHGKLDMDLFADNRTFIGVDLSQLSDKSPELFRGMIDDCLQFFQEGKLRPIRPVTTFEATDIVKAFRLMQSGRHMGKIVICMPEDPSTLAVSGIHEKGNLFRYDASYLLIGGFGGLGRAVATWMVEKGAQHLIILSRSGEELPRNRAFIEDLKSQSGCHVVSVTGSVANLTDTQRAVSAARKPIAGVIQMSMVLRDARFEDMTFEQWNEVLAPKVQGTWNLHHALDGQALDFFVLFSSLTGIIGFSGQTNYAASNTFLDAFVKYRHSQGLVASVLDIGFMGDIGYIPENSPKTLEYARSASSLIVTEQDLLHAIELSILSGPLKGPTQLFLGLGTSKPLSECAAQPIWGQDARLLGWQNVLTATKGQTTGNRDELRRLLEDVKRDPSILYKQDTEKKLTYELGKMIASHMSYSEDLELANIAVDSLMTIEIRAWLRRYAGLEVSLVEISKAGTVTGLSKITLKMLREKYQSGELEIANAKDVAWGSGEEDELKLCLQDIELGKDIERLSAQVADWYADGEGRVFMTGATGYLGAFFLALLSGLPQVKEVACLVRAEDVASGVSRIKEALAGYGLPFDFEQKLRIIPGDISSPTLGLSTEEFDELARWSSVIFHFASYSNYTLPYSSHREANVLGLVNVLRFANTGRPKALHYVSSISACGVAGYLAGQVIPEDQRPEFDLDIVKEHIGYTQSKVVAEHIAWNAISNGLPLTIYRPGFVMGHSVTGAHKQQDFINRLMANCLRIRSYPVAPHARNQFIPVDFVCSSMLRISLSSGNLCHAFNLVRPDQTQTVTWEETFEILNQNCTVPLQRVSPEQWIDIFAEHGNEREKAGVSLLKERLDGHLVWWAVDKGTMALYETSNMRRALSQFPEILEVPSVDDLIKTYLPLWSNQK